MSNASTNYIHVMLQRTIIKRRECLNSYYNSNAIIEIEGKRQAILCHSSGEFIALEGKKLRWQQKDKFSSKYKYETVVYLNKMYDEFDYVFTRVGKLHLLDRIFDYIYKHRDYLMLIERFKAMALTKLVKFSINIKEDELDKFNPGKYLDLLFPDTRVSTAVLPTN